MNTLYVMQGPPGSGKSYVANGLSKGLNAIVCSTDDYFYEGTFYNFRPEKLPENHKKNLERACTLLEVNPEQYDALSTEEAYNLLHAVFDRAADLAAEVYNEWIPTPGQIAHCDYNSLPIPYQQAVREYHVP